MELVELNELSDSDWEQLQDGEQDMWGSVGESLEWGEKDRRLALRDDDGRLVAAAGLTVVGIEVAEAAFDVVGLGGVVVTHTRRGEGLFWRVVDPVLELAIGLGPERAMLFCRPELESMYTKAGFRRIGAPVWAEQPEGRIEVPMSAMWRPLRHGATWPHGRVDVLGLPF